MAVTLLPLSNGRYSLEFESEDLPSVTTAIREHYGEPDQEQHPVSIEYRFGECSFTFQNEWNDPCLISRSAEGDEILKTLYENLKSAG